MRMKQKVKQKWKKRIKKEQKKNNYLVMKTRNIDYVMPFSPS